MKLWNFILKLLKQLVVPTMKLVVVKRREMV